jgi:hypothetical protein
MFRFLWFDDVQKENPNVKCLQFRRLVFGLTLSPAILSTVIQNHLSRNEDDGTVVPQLLKECLYVDDFAAGAENDQEALRSYSSCSVVIVWTGTKNWTEGI